MTAQREASLPFQPTEEYERLSAVAEPAMPAEDMSMSEGELTAEDLQQELTYLAIRHAANVDQRIYSNGHRHLYASMQKRDGTLGYRHLSHDSILEAYGYEPKSREYRQALAANLALKGAGVDVELTTDRSPVLEERSPNKVLEEARLKVEQAVADFNSKHAPLATGFSAKRTTEYRRTRSRAVVYEPPKRSWRERQADLRSKSPLQATKDKLTKAREGVLDGTAAAIEWLGQRRGKVVDLLGIRSWHDGGTYESDDRRERYKKAGRTGAAVLTLVGILTASVAGYEKYQTHQRAAQRVADREAQKAYDEWCAQYKTVSEANMDGCFSRAEQLTKQAAARHRLAQQRQAARKAAGPKSLSRHNPGDVKTNVPHSIVLSSAHGGEYDTIWREVEHIGKHRLTEPEVAKVVHQVELDNFDPHTDLEQQAQHLPVGFKTKVTAKVRSLVHSFLKLKT